MSGPLPGVPQCGKLVQCDRPSLRRGQPLAIEFSASHHRHCPQRKITTAARTSTQEFSILSNFGRPSCTELRTFVVETGSWDFQRPVSRSLLSFEYPNVCRHERRSTDIREHNHPVGGLVPYLQHDRLRAVSLETSERAIGTFSVA